MDHETKDRSTTDLVTEVANKETGLFERAFELAYFIHGNREIAFFIAEDAVEGLTSLLTHQTKNRAPAERLRGFWKWGERSRPIRKTLILDEYQMLQWLVYKQSEYWERQTEENGVFYTPSEEDLIVRYIEQLVFLTTRRGSFYVTLAIGSLLHQLDRRETRVFYDVLTQSDAARMKDTGYIGKQRLELLDKVLRRFEGMIKIVNKSGSDKQLLKQPSTESTTQLVKESLRRFTPWGTNCVINARFDVTDIPDLFFSGPDANEKDENLIEMNRIHTAVHPDCLSHFTNELRKYVRSLPDTDLDAGCDFDSLDERIAIPQFSNVKNEPPRRNRYETPKLQAEDYVRLRRTLDARGHRKKGFVPQTLSVYADGDWSYSFEPKNGNGHCVIAPETTFIEVRGKDSAGEVPLALLVRGPAQTNEEFEGSIVHAGGQKISLKTRHYRNGNESADGIQLEVNYQQSSGVAGVLRELVAQPKRRVTLTNDSDISATTTGLGAFAKVAIAVGVIAVIALLVWQFRSATDVQRQTPEETVKLPTPALEPQIVPSPLPSVAPPAIKDDSLQLAQARWSSDHNLALSARSLEQTRAVQQRVELSDRQTKTIISVPLYDSDGRSYSRYRMTLISSDQRLWQQTLTAPKTSITGYAHILEVVLFGSRLPKNSYNVEVEGLTGEEWHSLGEIAFRRP